MRLRLWMGVLAALIAVLWDVSTPGAQPAEELIAGRPLLLSAEELIYDLERRRVIARGQVELESRGYRLFADELRYLEAEGRVVARGQVRLVSPSGEVLFAEELELSDDLREGFIREVAARLDDDVRVAANLGVRVGGRYTIFEKAAFTPCPVCAARGHRPFWRIRAERVIHDAEARTITYRNAVLEVLGVPVLWVPYLAHPDPGVERQSGFLVPSLGSDTELGFTLETPYYLVLAPNRDLLLAPLLATREGPKLEVTLRDLQRFGRTELTASLAYARSYQRRPGQDRDFTLRGHVRAEGRYRLGEGERLLADLYLASDNTYLDVYDIDDRDVLVNRLAYERFAPGRFLGAYAFGFQGLREQDRQDRIPFALPWIQLQRRSGPLMWGSYATLDAGVRTLVRVAGLDSLRLSAELGWEMAGLGPIGDLWFLRLSLRGDLYLMDGDPRTLAGGPMRAEARLVPGLYARWRWPLVGTLLGLRQVIEPTVVLMAAPRGLNDPDIPNEDSLSFEFDETNLFRPSRFAGIDRVEEGLRIAYGVRFASELEGGFRVSGVVGQILRIDPGDEFPRRSGLDGRWSDLVGSLEVRPHPWLDLSYRFRLSLSELVFRRSDLALALGPPRLRLRLNYLKLTDQPAPGAPGEREQLAAGIRLGLSEALTIGGQFRYDLTQEEMVTASAGLVYRNPCFALTLGLERRFTVKGELEDETTLKVRVVFAGLGDVEASSAVLP